VRPLRSWTVYLAGVLGVAALAAPWIYLLVKVLAAKWPSWEILADHPFRRYVSRCLMLLALGGLWPLMRSLQIPDWQAVGLIRSRTTGRQVAMGFSLGTGLCIGLFLLGIRLDLRELALPQSLGRVVMILGGGVGAAGLVAFLEELLFRGALYSTVRRVHGWWLTMSFSTIIYAVSHFLARLHWEGPIGWWAGFAVLGRSLRALVEVQGFLPEFLVLLAAGGVLALARERSGTLWLPIGLHAGWVLGRKLADGFTEMTGPATQLQESLWSVLMLALTAAWVQFRYPGVAVAGGEKKGDAHDEPDESLA
jgi:membrane protease YdiL (CAAX protease family)